MGSPKKTIAYRYDAVGNRVGLTDPDGGRFTYAYDTVNRISHLVNPQGDRTTYAYDPGGRRTVKKLANGTRASFSYDTASNLTRLANLKSDGTTISSFDYRYDKVGNRTAVLEADSSRVTWSYDDTYQLTAEHRTGSHAYRDTYTYDASGNRLLKIHDGARTTYSYDVANQLEWSEDASGRTTYTFDADGNQERVLEPTGDRTTTSWDYENRTTLVQLPSGIRNTMAYEPGGLRVKLQESTATKKFVWDVQNYLAETDENDDTQVVYTNEPRVYGNLVSQRRGIDSHWYHSDAIGSTRQLTNATETVTDTIIYDASGQVIAASGMTAFAFQFVGELGYYNDAEQQLTYARARYYDPKLSRWTAIDPSGESTTPFFYIYSHNSPVNAVDPSGMKDYWCNPALAALRACIASAPVIGSVYCAMCAFCLRASRNSSELCAKYCNACVKALLDECAECYEKYDCQICIRETIDTVNCELAGPPMLVAGQIGLVGTTVQCQLGGPNQFVYAANYECDDGSTQLHCSRHIDDFPDEKSFDIATFSEIDCDDAFDPTPYQPSGGGAFCPGVGWKC